MTLADYKGQLLARQGNLAAQLKHERRNVVCMEADLVAARAQAGHTEGALVATERALAELEPLLTPAPKP